MKSFYVSLVIAIAALTLSQSAYANQDNVLNTIGDTSNEPLGDRNQAEVLLTEPASITNTWRSFTGQTNNPQQTPQSISVVQDKECQKFNPLELIDNPQAFFKQCQKQTNAQNSQSTEPIEYLKVPKLDSGISVTVTQF
ncbi:hypothetical protein [Nostoc sp. C117]|uniref:hypothetical protein n=1 Tax=Nostoc sp. C117 TaxID=3349875 RepID=UPI00370D5D99